MATLRARIKTARPGLAPACMLAVIGWALGAVGMNGASAAAALDNPVWVDDSPQAWEMLQQARAQREANVEEAIRLYQTLLDEYPFRLAPADASIDNRFISVRGAVLADLRGDQDLLDAYQRAVSAGADRMLASGAVERTAITHTLTSAGLRAMLELGQRSVEQGHFERGRAWLRRAIDHPQAGLAELAAAHRMLGTAAAYDGDAASYDRAVLALTELGESAGHDLAALKRLADFQPPPRPARGVTPMDRTEADGLNEIVSQTIWTEQLDSSLYARRFGDGAEFIINEERRRGGDREGRFATIAPTIAASVVYVNEGHRVRAVDRFTGRDVWRRPHVDRPGLRVIDRDNEVPQDLNLIAVDEGMAVTTTGHGYATDRSSEGGLIALDAATGELRWSASFDRLGGDDAYEGLYPYGRPIIREGLVYVLARSTTRQLVTTTYLVAVDMRDGSPRWIRHIASSGEQVRSGRPMTSPVWRDGVIYVSTPVGAMAAIDATTSETLWLHRESVPITTRGGVRRPWELNTPAVTDRSVIALTPDQRRIIELDRARGTVLRSTEATSRSRWNGPSYLLTNDEMVYGIGSEIRAFAADDLDALMWMLPPLDPEAIGPGEPIAAAHFEIAGRVQVVGDRLIAPTDAGTMVIDAETGRVLRLLDTRGAGNPVAAGGEIVVAASASLDAYMSLPRAEALLRQRIAEHPSDAEPALSLMQLAMRVADFELALEGAALAQSALEREMERTHQQELFDGLVAVHRRALAPDDDGARALYALMARCARSADQDLEHRLARADWLSRSTPVEAALAYRAILDEPTLAPVWRRENGMIRSASTWAAMRLLALVNEHGEPVRQAMDSAAAAAMVELTSAPNGDDPRPERLIELAERHPVSSLAAEWRVRAARAWLEQDEPRKALAAVLAGVNRMAGAPDEDRLLGAAVDVARMADWPRLADRILAYATLERPGMALVDLNGDAGAATTWRSELRSASGRLPRENAPTFGAIDESAADVLAGALVPLHEDLSAHRPHAMTDAALLRTADELRLVAAAGDVPKWTTQAELDADAAILDVDDERILLFAGQEMRDPHLIAFDRATGERRWVTDRLDALVTLPAVNRPDHLSQMPNGFPFNPEQTLARLGADAVFLVHRTGRVAAFDARDGRIVLWAKATGLEAVHLAAVEDHALVLAGMAPGDDRRGGAQPAVLILDPRTGERLHQMRPAGGTGVVWMRVDPLGGLLLGTRAGVERVDLFGGGLWWMNQSYDAQETRRGWHGPAATIVEDQLNTLRRIGVREGGLSGAYERSAPGAWESITPIHVTVEDGGAVAHYRDRVLRYDRDGRISGADVVAEPRDYRWLLMAADGMIAISQYDIRQAAIEGEIRRRTVRTYRIYPFSPDGRIEGAAIELPPNPNRLVEARMINGAVLLSTEDQTLVLPMRVEGAERPKG